ncbi:MarR family transcriptional regulator [Pseudokineococcus sp. 5B2Z-1]|uniref:MarR family winged helix-turn-helix transcriptional regulator n=1 Tax=Pseudokineococcus sp. 5B2Z-1 TaxID=3132744 RepID=UPI0030A531B8
MDADRALTEAELDGVVTWNVVRVARYLGQRLAERLAELDLHPVHFGVLAQLDISGPMSQADLARAVLLRPQSIAPLLDGLERRGLLERTGERARGRRNPVLLTASGREALEGAWGVALSSNDLRDSGLTAEEGGELNRLLLKVVGASRGRVDDDAAWDLRGP